MCSKSRRMLLFAFTLVLIVVSQLPVGGPSFLYAQSAGEGAGNASQPNPELCTRCYLQLQKDNRECESLKGQDWQICRDAASAAYRQCSQGC
jgi:hypothetical protein